jgi:hypothetical protein
MANSLTEQLNSLYTTTWVNRMKGIVDNIMTATPIYFWLTKKGRTQSLTGGRRIECPLRIAKNETVTAIGRGGSVSLADTDNLSVAYYDWKYLTGHLIRYFADFQMNRSRAQLESKVNADIDSLRDSQIDKFETDIHGAGTADNGLTIGGLQQIIDTTPATGTVGGIDPATYTWWRNQATNMTGLAVSTYLIQYMRTMYNDCGNYGEGVSRFPDFIITNQSVYESYEEEALEIGRIMMADRKMADLGFGDLSFKGSPITWSPAAPNYEMRFLNTNHLKWVTDAIANMKLGEFKAIVQQPEDYVAHLMSVCNLVCDNRVKQGVLYNIGN